MFIPAGTPNVPVIDNVGMTQNLILEAGASLAISADAAVLVAGDLDAGYPSITGTGAVQVVSPTGTIRGAVPDLFVLGGYTTIESVIAAGQLVVGGDGALNVAGRVSTQGLPVVNTSLVIMQQPTDSLIVAGNAVFDGGSTAGLLTAGTLEVGGDLVQLNTNGHGTSFSADAGHLTVFTGARSPISQVDHRPGPSQLGVVQLYGGDRLMVMPPARRLHSGSIGSTRRDASRALVASTTPSKGWPSTAQAPPAGSTRPIRCRWRITAPRLASHAHAGSASSSESGTLGSSRSALPAAPSSPSWITRKKTSALALPAGVFSAAMLSGSTRSSRIRCGRPAASRSTVHSGSQRKPAMRQPIASAAIARRWARDQPRAASTARSSCTTPAYPTLDDVPPYQARTRHFNHRRSELIRHGEHGAEEEAALALAGIRRMAKENGMTTAELAIKWALAGQGISCCLIGARKVEKLDENVRAVAKPLSSDIIQALDTVTRPVLDRLGDSFDYYESVQNNRTR